MNDFVKNAAFKAGFVAARITTADPVVGYEHLLDAIESGRIAEMPWLSRDPKSRCDPKSLLKDAKSVICCAYPYHFSRNTDYHPVVRDKLKQLWSEIKGRTPDAKAKICVDTSPILEKALAHRAGLGWIGKHTVLVNEKLGSFFVLGEIITDIELNTDEPATNLCGDCNKCIEACPTSALIAPHKLDSGQCISYLTTFKEPAKGDQFGCDICQKACPFNDRES